MAPSFGDLKSAAGLKSLDEYLLTRSYIEGFSLSAADQSVFAQINGAPDKSSYVHAYRWYLHIAALGGVKSIISAVVAPAPAPATSQPPAGKGKKAKKAAKKEEDDDADDLFGDDDEFDAAAAAEARKKKAEAAKAKKKKAKPVERSQLIFEVKPWEADQDLKSLFAKITALKKEGLSWGEGYEIKPVAFGIMKLVMSCVIVDDLVGMDDVTDPIEAMEDEVQSVDVLTMNKM
uniref:Translation elongation factor EF1B beta/delta subunit guanine nucleotide exchange domain-containing protein n=1 Tax=Fibrocapsa japonica TaxID=94617 RepID=A0A7S2UXP5_9STRA|mmetsp:Transcript_13986/g.20624  ORF Transcript_13986/g.20624 Transcript_13986/m.20624 type:complete len:233 (+) Transcript_13986:108-806(+)|eukprot:CAMPEP_0113942794 /NCGR_PEP_ID=MMETSP1339-20121228/9653_1 /TAXON_ID=94617 /ORGANISM="Fibrocapsa japonica" /LENGTH=232 /DNA_ID=CAMNT_0000947417 /DNA_START=60 /DNA_END=758 /DNA_ORIENTATION=+ /assembly_acc=CAM_ASM_000762